MCEHHNQKYAYGHRALILYWPALIDNSRTKCTRGRDRSHGCVRKRCINLIGTTWGDQQVARVGGLTRIGGHHIKEDYNFAVRARLSLSSCLGEPHPFRKAAHSGTVTIYCAQCTALHEAWWLKEPLRYTQWPIQHLPEFSTICRLSIWRTSPSEPRFLANCYL